MLQIRSAVAEFARIKGVRVPTYQYVCNQCEELTEAVQGFHDEPLTECPKCKGGLRKIFSTAGVVFKGTGFYKTDSRGTTSSD